MLTTKPAGALLFLLVFFSTAPLSATELGPINPETIDTIAFGSCAREDQEQPIWETISAEQPDLFLFIGDCMYADIPKQPESAGDIAAAWRALGAKPGYQKLLSSCPVLATWDDHDYGLNDAGKEFALKRQSQTLLLSFFNEPPQSPRWSREGVYGAWMFGPEGKRVQVLLLDTRYFRDPIDRDPSWKNGAPIGPYRPNGQHEKGTLLGEKQWAWLETQLRKPADLRIIGSSIQVVASEHGWEGWCNFPAEQQRLYDLIGKTKAAGVVFISGDRHMIEMSKKADRVPYPMWDFTSSGFTIGHGKTEEPNRYRVGPVLRQPNFGLIRIDWSAGPTVTLEGKSERGASLMKQTFALPTLRPN